MTKNCKYISDLKEDLNKLINKVLPEDQNKTFRELVGKDKHMAGSISQ